MAIDEHTLLTNLAADVPGAFPELVHAVQDDLYSGLRGLCRNDADAADAAQETLLRAFRALAGYEPDRIERLRLRGWLWTIALNVVRNTARTRSRRPREVALTPATGAPPSPAAEDEADIAGPVWAGRLALLPAAQRNAVVLRHVLDMSYEDIAAATRRPVGTVKADVHRGIVALRRILDGEETS